MPSSKEEEVPQAPQEEQQHDALLEAVEVPAAPQEPQDLFQEEDGSRMSQRHFLNLKSIFFTHRRTRQCTTVRNSGYPIS